MADNPEEWKHRLHSIVRGAKATVIGSSKISYVHHAALVATAILAFGDDPKATFYIEGLPTTGNIPRPDLILIHPDIGVLVIENKGVKFADIHGVQDVTMRIVRDGRLKEEDPFEQAERVKFRLQDLVARRIDLSEVLFLRTAALPRIGREEFEQRFEVRWPDETLFGEECADPARFKAHLLGFSNHTQKTAKRKSKLSKHAHDAVMTVLNGKGFIYSPRRTYINEENKHLLGVQIQEMELGLKEATQQQKELGRADLRGHHRLFRGVAGSGKSIMLALSVAHALHKYREEAETLFAAAQPKRRVLVCCFNKTLVHYLKQRIDDRFGRLAWDKPDAESLTVVHFEGLAWQLKSRAKSLDTGLDYNKKAQRAELMAEAWDNLEASARDSLSYDAVYLDEAQDLSPEEIRFLLRLARKDEKGGQTFIVFFDNAQNIYGVKPPVWNELGVNIVGRTEFLDQCLRNTRETLAFAFNVLVGSFAPEGQRATTRQFADVNALVKRGLVEESAGHFAIKFSPRTGLSPKVDVYADRRAEIDGVAEIVRDLVSNQKVLPSDILVLYKSHWKYKDTLPKKLETAIGSAFRLRLVDKDHEENKRLPLLEDGLLTVSTIASAKGYDAPVVILMGVDQLGGSNEDRATFYVGATRAKLQLIVSGVREGTKTTLFDEIIATDKALGSRHYI